jgi:hypothetical protein
MTSYLNHQSSQTACFLKCGVKMWSLSLSAKPKETIAFEMHTGLS